MIALYIFLAVVFLVVFLLFIDFSIVIVWKEEFNLKVKVFLFPLNLEKTLNKSAQQKTENKIINNQKNKKRRKNSCGHTRETEVFLVYKEELWYTSVYQRKQ